MYDNVCKFIAEMFSEDFATWLLGVPIPLTELKPTELSLQPIRADSLIFLQSDNLVLHIEFQTEPKTDIPFRMADYRLRVYRKFPQKEMYQVVIYLKKSNSELVQQNTFELTELRHRFNVIRLWEESPEPFLNKPGLFPFAVLTQTENPINVLTQVAEQINQISNRKTQSDLAASTAILAGLSLNQRDIRRILRSEIMRESVIYQEILAEGEQIGERRGEQIGEQRGEQQATEKIALNLLQAGMEIEQVAQMTELTIEQIQALQLRLENN